MRVLFCDWLGWVYGENNELKNLFDNKNVDYTTVLPGTRNIWEQKMDLKNIEPYNSRYYKHYDLDSMIKVPLYRKTGWYKIDEEYRNILRAEVVRYIEYAGNEYRRLGPNWVVVEGGLTHFTKPLVEVAKEMNINVLAIENSFIRDKIILEFEIGCVCNRHSFAKTIKDKMENYVVTGMIRNNFEEFKKQTFNRLKFKNMGGQFKVDRSKKIVFIPMQVFNDQVVLYDSEYNNEDFLKIIFRVARDEFKDWQFLIKLHPKEELTKGMKNTGSYLKTVEIPDNVEILENGAYSTQELIDISNMVWCINSQAGLEACLKFKPVILFGNAFYGGCGFTEQYKEGYDFEYLKYHYDEIIQNRDKIVMFYYFYYKWLYNRVFKKEDRRRVSNIMGI
jgi:capsule polysaccharide export protein KpsC/LpsZ